MIKQFLTALLATLLLPIVLAGAVSACPNCKNSLPDSDDPGLLFRLRDGYVWSYIGMSSVPFIMAGTFGRILYKRIKSADDEDLRSE